MLVRRDSIFIVFFWIVQTETASGAFYSRDTITEIEVLTRQEPVWE